jgi:chromosome partitioning protein
LTATSRAPPPPSRTCGGSAWRARLHRRHQGAALRTQVRQLASKYDDIVIDVGGRDTGSLRAALTVADTLLIPVQPRTFDVWSVDHMAELIREARAVNERLCALAVLNGADSAGKDNDEAAAAVADTDGIACLDVRVVRRKAFPNAAAAGRSVVEQAGQDPNAAAELTALVAALYDGVCISG